MADSRHSPTVRRRRLARELRKLREQAGLTADQVTRRLEWAEGKVNRLERALAVRPRVFDVRALLELYGVTDEEEREALFTLTREARQRGWWAAYGVLDDNYVEFEAEASHIHTWQPLVIPGLLQAPGYARAIQRGWLMKDDEEEVERLVQLRMERQKILTSDKPPKVWAVIDENAVARSFGSAESKAEQLERLIETERLEHVIVQIMPMRVDPHPGLSGAFVILDYEDDPSLVYREIRPSSLYQEDPSQIEERRTAFQYLSATALGPNESIAYLKRLAKQSE
ncbi:helix-turn-helix domain-containing protein [Actinoallomurus rhizosphaericola]|uniref:helix-turn-helix domain-containing protein n=1 Tax=Actinoallomurus rhizosphaericola TaxID=2952536 RepID=UPI002090F85B|nr:helix-turn-helix transcriptional regulator [Actinoallomurus rhizosphaericola]MCO5994274.1 helix-turn-helix domain-containing protein [Actinoallomurus rhizosphaericola]